MMRSLWLACAIGCTVPVQASHGPPTWSTAGPSVVSVLPTWPGFTRPGLGAPPGTAPEGSGVFWSPNAGAMSQYLLTAAHVVARATAIQVRMADGVLIDAAVIGLDRETDLALLATSVSGPAIRVAERRPSTGSHVCALGNAFGLGVSMTCGVVSQERVQGIGFNPIEDFIQTDAAINPGASGGALVDADGRMVGLVAAIFTKETDANTGVNFAISSELVAKTAKRFLSP